MLYKKNTSKTLDLNLFKNPTSEYRATPFWAWNDDLEKDELVRQIDELKQMGFGGFHMHVRSGLNTPYLSDEFFNLIKSCTDKAKKEEMLAWLYDEDRWPSGAAGGFVTKNLAFCRKYFSFTVKEDLSVTDFSNYVLNGYDTVHDTAISDDVVNNGRPYLLAVYDVVLDEKGKLKEYKAIKPNDGVKGNKWFVYVKLHPISGWFNNQRYIDILNKDAVKEFINVTHERYYKSVGDEFDKTIPAIFTDEPAYECCNNKEYATDLNAVNNCWTTDLPNTFYNDYGVNLVARLPELIWDLANGEPSVLRYYYYNHICERYHQAFETQIGRWCEEHNIHFTGHVLSEANLKDQTRGVGEAMRHYTEYGIPGIDMLCNGHEFSTAKQCQSVVHQTGKEGMLSELYGVTGWDFDFRGHKLQGDWQACLGVSVRVPHLAWYSMKGSAKRDYPASINYQSAWYKEYKYVEDHFARLNTVLTRGKASVDVAVLHPIESYWLSFGPSSTSGEVCSQLENSFTNLRTWLLEGTVDFDYISESTVNKLYKGVSDCKLNFGEMNYKTIVVGGLITIRSETVKMLNDFIDNGGNVLFVGDAPYCIDGVINDDIKKLYAKANKCTFTKNSLLGALENDRYVEIRDQSGSTTKEYFYNKRIDGDVEWLFIAHAKIVNNPEEFWECKNLASYDLSIKIKGEKIPELYDTILGEIKKVSYNISDGYTMVYYTVDVHDSVLLKLTNAKTCDEKSHRVSTVKYGAPDKVIDFKLPVKYSLAEPNVAVLDIAKYSLDDKNYEDLEELLKIDLKIRKIYNYPLADGCDVQPWVIGKETEFVYPYLKFNVESEVEVDCMLAFEQLEELYLNGEKVDVNVNGYFTDRHIYTTKIPKLKIGDNEIIVKVALGKRTSLENMFLLGDFGVEISGATYKIVAKKDKIAFGNVINQGLPFYGAEISYEVDVETDNCDMLINASRYIGALISVDLDGKNVGKIVYSPYELLVKDVKKGKHTIKFNLYLTRVNSFNGLHNIQNDLWVGPDYWYPEDRKWAYEYQLKNNGIMRSPVIKIFNK